MKSSGFALIAAVLALSLAGCFPEKRVTWSPDGRWAAVIGGDGVYLSDAAGKLSPRIAEHVAQAVWLPDSRGLLVVRSETAKTWVEAATDLSGERRELIKAVAERVRTQTLAYTGDWSNFKPEGLSELTPGEAGAALLYIRDERPEGLPEKLGEKWEELRKAEVSRWFIQLAEVGDRGVQLKQVIYRSLDAAPEPRIAPDGQAVAFIQPLPGPDESGTRLYVQPLSGAEAPRPVAEHVANYPDWSADSRALVFANCQRWPSSKELVLGSIGRRQVRDASGKLLEKFPDIEDLAGVLFQQELKVRCLRSGRIIFAAMEVNLPATAADMPQRGLLFAVDPGESPAVMRLIPRKSEAEAPDLLYFFEVSPDERHVSMPGGGGQVSVLKLATGDIKQVVPQFGLAGELLITPTWRSADELCCMGPGAEGSERAVLNLAKIDYRSGAVTATALSTDWPESVARGFLIPEPKGESQPAGKTPE